VTSADAVTAALPLIALELIALAIVGTLVGQPWLKERRRAQIRARPFPAAWRRILRHRAPIVARLPSDLQIRLRRHIQVFLAEKPFIGCQGQAITDEVRVTVAAHACLLLLGHERPDYYPRLRQVLVLRAVADGRHSDLKRPLRQGAVVPRQPVARRDPGSRTVTR
jgi:MtfA peptidase